MKKTIFLSLIIFQFGFLTFSQSLKSEYQYLYLINKQGNEEIIEDNLRNAELVAYYLIKNPEKYTEYGNLFFTALTESYLKTENYEKAFFTLARQIIFFPNPDNKNTESFLKLVSDGAEIQNPEKLYADIKNSGNKNRDKKFTALFDAMISENIDNIDDLLYEYIRLYKTETKSSEPDRLKQYEFYTKIGIKNKHKFKMISFNEKSDDFLHLHNDLTAKQKRKIISAAFKYYIGIKNKKYAKKILNECKKQRKTLKGFLCIRLKTKYLFSKIKN